MSSSQHSGEGFSLGLVGVVMLWGNDLNVYTPWLKYVE